MVSVWRRIERLAEARGWRQIDLARQSGVRQSAISKWKRGTQEPDRKSLVKIAAALGVSVDQLEGTAALPATQPIGHLRSKEAAVVQAYRDLGPEFRKIVDTLVEQFRRAVRGEPATDGAEQPTRS